MSDKVVNRLQIGNNVFSVECWKQLGYESKEAMEVILKDHYNAVYMPYKPTASTISYYDPVQKRSRNFTFGQLAYWSDSNGDPQISMVRSITYTDGAMSAVDWMHIQETSSFQTNLAIKSNILQTSSTRKKDIAYDLDTEALGDLTVGDKFTLQIWGLTVPANVTEVRLYFKRYGYLLATLPNSVIGKTTDYIKINASYDTASEAPVNDQLIISLYVSGGAELESEFSVQKVMFSKGYDTPSWTPASVEMSSRQVVEDMMGVANGIARLDSNALVPMNEIPELSLSKIPRLSADKMPEGAENVWSKVYLAQIINLNPVNESDYNLSTETAPSNGAQTYFNESTGHILFKHDGTYYLNWGNRTHFSKEDGTPLENVVYYVSENNQKYCHVENYGNLIAHPCDLIPLGANSPLGTAEGFAYPGNAGKYLELKTDNLDETVSEHDTDINNLKSTSATHTSKIAVIDLSISSLQATIESQASQISALNSNVADHLSRIQWLEGKFAELNTRLSALE